MAISEASLKKFMEIYKREFDEDISVAEAREMAQRLVNLYVLLLRPLPGERSDGKQATPPFSS